MTLLGGALGERNFRYLVSARTISFFGTNLAPIAVAFAVLDLTDSATDVGIAFACWTLAQISTLLVGGVVADRLARRLVMLSSDSANFAIRATMGALLFRCPKTDQEVDIGIDTDPRSLSTIRFFSVRGYCPHCRDTHDWNISDGRSDEPCQKQHSA